MEDGVKSEVLSSSEKDLRHSQISVFSENAGLIVFLCALGLIIIGLSIIIMVLNFGGFGRGDEDNSDDGAINLDDVDCLTKTVTIPGILEEWDEVISPEGLAAAFSEEVDKKMDKCPGYTIKDALQDYQNTVETYSGNFKFYIALPYALFINERLGDIVYAKEVMDSVYDIAMVNSDNEGIYYETFYKLYNEAGDELNAVEYRTKYDNLMNNKDGSNYEKD